MNEWGKCQNKWWGEPSESGCCLVIVSLCHPMDCSTSGFPILHHLPGLAQTHVHWVYDAIQPSHPLSSPSPPAFNLSQHQGFFQWVNSLHQVVKVLEFQLQHQSFQWIFRVDFLWDWLVGSPCSPRDSSRVSSNTTVQKHQFFSTQNLGILSKKYMWWGFFIPRDFVSVGLGWGQTNLFSLRLGWPQSLWEDLEESLAWETVELLHKMTLICQWDLFLPSWLQAKGPLSLFLLLAWMFFFKSIFEIDLGSLHLSPSAFLASQSYMESGGALFSLLITLSSCLCFSIGTGCLCHLNFLQK